MCCAWTGPTSRDARVGFTASWVRGLMGRGLAAARGSSGTSSDQRGRDGWEWIRPDVERPDAGRLPADGAAHPPADGHVQPAGGGRHADGPRDGPADEL